MGLLSSGNDDIAHGGTEARDKIRPWQRWGNTQRENLNKFMKDPEAFFQNPLFLAQMNQGLEGINRSAAAAGYRGSGNVLTELQKFGQTFAMDSWQRQFQNLFGLAGMGYQAAQDMATLDMNQGLATGGNKAAAAGGILGGIGSLAGGMNLSSMPAPTAKPTQLYGKPGPWATGYSDPLTVY
jgi:hypothetical protein